MSVYRRRVMQVKHPPNQITAVYNVTSTTSYTTLYNGIKIPGNPFVKMYIDGVESSGPLANYKFSTKGLHEVVFVLNSGSYYGSGEELFLEVRELYTIDFSEFRGEFTSCLNMFQGCHSLISVTNLKITSAAITLQSMFSGCYKLLSLDASGWDLRNVTSIAMMLSQCYALETLDITGWELDKATKIYTFCYDCNALHTLKGKFRVTNAVAMNALIFTNCAKLEFLDLSDCDFSNVGNWNQAIAGCSSLKELRLNTEVSDSATNLNTVLENSGVSNPILYYYPHASFVEKFLPIVPAKWTLIDITTLE